MKKFVVLVWLMLLGAAVVAPVGVSLAAATPAPSPTPQTCAQDASGKCSDLFHAQSCVNVALPIVTGGATCVNNDPAQGGAIIVYLREVLQLMSSAVGIVIVLMLVVAGIQYITSTGNPSLVGAAKKRIMNALTALFLFLFMVTLLQFIVPGGIL